VDTKEIRVRIMCEAYDLADRGDTEGYNSVKVMCSDVLALINKYIAPPKQWVGLTLNEAEDLYEKYTDRAELINAVDKLLEEKNT
jgi:hypothetical protein